VDRYFDAVPAPDFVDVSDFDDFDDFGDVDDVDDPFDDELSGFDAEPFESGVDSPPEEPVSDFSRVAAFELLRLSFL
jgi:hypothetical protein